MKRFLIKQLFNFSIQKGWDGRIESIEEKYTARSQRPVLTVRLGPVY